MAQESVTIALFQSKSFFQAFLESSVIFLPHTSSFKDILCHWTSCLTSRSRLGNWVLNHSPKDSLKWKCFTRLSLTFTHKTLAVLLPFYFLYLSSPFITLCALSISSKKPQDVNLPYVSYSFFKKKKNLSLPSVLGRTLLLNHLMVKQWSAIFRLVGWLFSRRPALAFTIR